MMVEKQQSQQQPQQFLTNECPKCGNTKLVLDVVAGEEICVPCGIVVNEKVETTEVMKQYVNEGSKPGRDDHHGNITRVSRFGMDGSVIATLDADNQQVQDVAMMHRLRKLDGIAKSNNSKSRAIKKAMLQLDAAIPKLRLPYSVQERAAYLLRKAIDAKLIKGRSVVIFVASCIYIACREMGSYRDRKEILNQMGVSTKRKDELTDYLTLMSLNFGIENKRIYPASLVPKIIAESGLSQKTERDAIEFLTKHLEDVVFIGKDPRVIAAATVYLFSVKNNDTIPHWQMTIASNAGVTTVSMRKRFQDIIDLMRKDGIIAQQKEEEISTKNDE